MTFSMNNVTQILPNDAVNPVKMTTPSEAQASFGKALKSAIEGLNNIQQESDLKTEALANGKIDDLHDVMITAQKASITLETTVQMQRKAIDAYNEIMRMQV